MCIAEALDKELSPHNGLKERLIGVLQGIKSPLPFAIEVGRLGELPQELEGFGGIADNGEGVQVAAVSRPGDIAVAVEVGNALAHWEPGEDDLSFPFAPTSHQEIIGTIDYCFDTQYAAQFVVHFNPVLFHPVFDASARQTLEVGGFQPPFEVAVKFATKEMHDILGAETDGGMPLQIYIQPLQGGNVGESDIGGIFGLVYNPVIAPGAKQVIH